MSALITIEIQDTKGVTAMLAEAAALMRDGKKLNGYIARSLVNGRGDSSPGVQAHIRLAASTRHKTAERLGAVPTNILASVTAEPYITETEAGVILSDARPFANLLSGLIIKPTAGKKWLTIPACAETYGKLARNFDNLRFIPPTKAKPWLAYLVFAESAGPRQPKRAGESQTAKAPVKKAKKPFVAAGKVNKLKVAFWLLRQAKLPQDRGRLPSDARLLTLAELGALEALETLV